MLLSIIHLCECLFVYLVLMPFLNTTVGIDILSKSKNHMLPALSLRINNLVSKLSGLCYDSWIVSLSLYLSPCLDMVLVYCSFTSLLET